MMSVIDNYIKSYRLKLNLYQEASQICARQCEAGLDSLGIKSIVTYRAKRTDRLREKLLKRIAEKVKYNSVEEIHKDIADLAGVRIALYFPGNQKEVGRFIESQFDLTRPPKVFPRDSKTYRPIPEKKFRGYSAIHYIVNLKKSILPKSQHRYLNTPIEIQVASVLMHAWAEVEHDLIYKPIHGELSDDEYAILDELNGLVLTGEISLQRLQKAVETRVGEKTRKFRNHYELASYLLEAVKPIVIDMPDEPPMGRVDLLFRLLKEANLDTPVNVAPLIKALQQVTEQRPIAEQITDEILAANPNLYETYDQIRSEQDKKKPYSLVKVGAKATKKEEAIGFFLNQWIELERILGALVRLRDPKTPLYRIISPSFMKELGIFDDEIFKDIYRIRRFRNLLIHGIEIPNVESLINEGEVIEKIVKKLKPIYLSKSDKKSKS